MTPRSVPYRAPTDLLADLAIEQPEEIELEAIAQHCGALIVYEPLTGCEARILGCGDRAIITANETSCLRRKRFSVAHELGHWNRDRGLIAYACSELQLKTDWASENRKKSPEQRANEFAAELLMPTTMFELDSRNQPIDFTTVEALEHRYTTSLTATALRLVRCGSFPSMVVCSRHNERWKWFKRSPDLPRNLWPRDMPTAETVAHDLLEGKLSIDQPIEVSAAGWFDHEVAVRHVIREHSRLITDGLVLTLLWWEDEGHLLEWGGL